MANTKYIGTKETMRLTGLKQEEVYELIHSGKLPARKAPKSGWRILPEDLAALGLIKEERETVFEEPITENCATYVADELVRHQAVHHRQRIHGAPGARSHQLRLLGSPIRESLTMILVLDILENLG